MRYLDELRAKGDECILLMSKPETVAIKGDSLLNSISQSEFMSMNIAPVFDSIAFEYYQKWNDGNQGRVLCLTRSSITDEWDNGDKFVDKARAKEIFNGAGLLIDGNSGNVAWITAIFLKCEGYDGGWIYVQLILEDGTPSFGLAYNSDADSETFNNIFPCLAAMAIMNCKNSRLDDIPNSPSYERRFAKWNKIPATRYKEIKVFPVGKKLHTGVMGESGIRQSLHIARGHFKDYRDHGLFGKMKGVYWWSPTLRGDLDRGLIDKTYNVFPSPRKKEERKCLR